MKILYLECKMGASGDMLMGALLNLLPNPETFLDAMERLHLPEVRISSECITHCGIAGMKMHVLVRDLQEGETICEHHHEHSHSDVETLSSLIGGLDLPQSVRTNALAVFQRIAEAESKVHNIPVSQIHFHEVGSLDAVADIVGVSLLLDMLAPDRIVVSPIHLGSGMVCCDHGMLPVPAPATVELLRGVPCYTGDIPTELCTPTGAALLRQFADNFGNMPVMTIENIGYGFGTKQLPAANCVRAFQGQLYSEAAL